MAPTRASSEFPTGGLRLKRQSLRTVSDSELGAQIYPTAGVTLQMLGSAHPDLFWGCGAARITETLT